MRRQNYWWHIKVAWLVDLYHHINMCIYIYIYDIMYTCVYLCDVIYRERYTTHKHIDESVDMFIYTYIQDLI